MSRIINFASKLKKFSDYWSPKIIAIMNDYEFKVVKIKGEFIWHNHKETDEVFIVLEGSMSIKLKNKTLNINKGEMIVIKSGEQHKPFANNECHILIIEPKGVINTGEAGLELTSDNEIWI